MHHTNLWRGTASLMLVGLACSSGKSSGPAQVVPAGAYTLRTINGLSIPVTILLQTGYRLELTSATLTIQSPTKFTNASSYRKTLNGGVTTPDELCVGEYTVSEHTISFVETGAAGSVCGVVEQETGGSRGVVRRYTGTWDGANRITVDFDPTTHSIYEK